jgi:molybdopterin adenylyltransferase
VKTAVLTISSSVARGGAPDASGDLLARLAEEAGGVLSAREAIADDAAAIAARLRHHCDEGCAFVFTTGGTGFTLDDVTPEATRAVIEREAPGFAEAMRARSLGHTPMGLLSRGASGLRGSTLIVNFPGSPKAIEQVFPILAPTLRHVAEQLNRRGSRGTSGH